MDAWFDERFLAAAARDHHQTRWRAGVTVGVGLLLAIAADWRPALAWTAAALILEAPLWYLMAPVAEGAPLKSLRAWGMVILRLVLTWVWIFPAIIFFSYGRAGGQVCAVGFAAALLLYMVTRRDRSPPLAFTAMPALLAPLLIGLLFPSVFLLEKAAVLLFAGLMSGLAGAALLRELRGASPAAGGVVRSITSRGLAPAPRPESGAEPGDDEELSLESLREAKAQAEAASLAKSAFLATMSHEIRTPLNGVLGMTQALAADPTLTQHQRARLDMIRASGESLLAILNDILDLSKVEAGKLELESIEFDLEAIAQGAHAQFKAMAVDKGLEFKLAIDPAAKGAYLGDPTRVRQVIYNLISNALKFTERGEIRVAIDPAPGGGLRLTVADTGIGMAPEQLQRIFDKFEQADASSTRRYGGTGLGLAICRDLCGLMGGSITAESEPGRGARFTVVLPLPQVTEPAAAGALPAVGEAAEAEAEDAAALRILAAEDNPTNQMVLKALLAQVGVEPVMVENGALALEAWTTGEFDLILMDIQMPQMDGMEATRAIRRAEAETGRARTPIVALTANAMSHQVAEYAAAGMDAHVPKPIDVAALFATMERLLNEPAEAPPQPAKRRRAS